MTRRSLAGENSPPQQSTSSTSSPPSLQIQTVDSNFAVILAVLLCALICVLGLAAVARCAWIRRISSIVSSTTSPANSANKGLKKKVLKSLPSLTYRSDNEKAAKHSDCAICLADFAAGEEIRVLPQCGHGFHIGCIDTWLGSHSSCPSCRQVLVVKRCQKYDDGGGIQPEPRENHVNSFLP